MIEERYALLTQKVSLLSKLSATICVVSKQQPVESIYRLYKQGVRDFGENRAQELVEKARYFESQGMSDIRWHFIGHIQSRQIPNILRYSFLVHSVHDKKTLLNLEKRCKFDALKANVLLQVNVSGEESKQGMSEPEIIELAKEALTLSHVTICGLMTMAPQKASAAFLVETFQKTRLLRQKLETYLPKCQELSMGMSQDFEMALKEGSTLIRIGSLIFNSKNEACS